MYYYTIFTLNPEEPIRWGAGATFGTLIPKLNHRGANYSIFKMCTNGVIETAYSNQEHLSRTQAQFRDLGGNVTEYAATIHLSQLVDEARLTQFFDTCSQIIQDIRAKSLDEINYATKWLKG